ncbi:restriction endonuclease subunit S [Helicobacter pylori]|uniref:restriction endonuclease subunit S n=1 Tax=Helicobacter pylori TaxID=210 RepID=UPI0003FE5444|nr:restriction endonuclease subunit S [Helicobacter pylori]
MSKTLQDYATLINDTIQSNEINHYITTDNMCQNLGGIDTFKNINIPQGKVRSFQKDDVLLSNIRLYFRKVYRAKQKGGCSSDVLVFRAKHINSATLFAILSSQIFTDYACSGSQGSKMPRGNKTHMMNFKIPTINFTIAKIFNSIQNKIENNHKINELLHKILELLYEQYFVRFDFLDENNKPYQTNGGKMKFSKELNRLIPNGWSVKFLDHKIVSTYQPKTISKTLLNDSYSYNVYGGGGIIGRFTEYNHEQSEFIISCRGQCGISYLTLPKSWITGNAMVIRPTKSYTSKTYLYHTIKKYKLKNYITGSVQSQITRQNLSTMPILIPKRKTLNKWNNISSLLWNLIHNNMQATQTLTTIRDFLLPLLLKQQVKPKNQKQNQK